MKGVFFCDVCSIEFRSRSNDHRAVCPSCKVDVLDVSEQEPIEDPYDIDFSVPGDPQDYC